jgi:hypothetical protein
MTIEMVNPVGVIMEELADRRMGQRTVALTYAYIIRQEPNADWPTINAAIMARWRGRTALVRVKTMAWKWVDDWQAARGAERRA